MGVFAHPPPLTRRTASELITVVHRPKPLLPSSGFFFARGIPPFFTYILDTQQQRVCSVGLIGSDSANLNLCTLLQEYSIEYSQHPASLSREDFSTFLPRRLALHHAATNNRRSQQLIPFLLLV